MAWSSSLHFGVDPEVKKNKMPDLLRKTNMLSKITRGTRLGCGLGACQIRGQKFSFLLYLFEMNIEVDVPDLEMNNLSGYFRPLDEYQSGYSRT